MCFDKLSGCTLHTQLQTIKQPSDKEKGENFISQRDMWMMYDTLACK